MSAASKSKALRPWRVRERVARELAKVIIASPHGVRAHSTRTGGFDVHAAREHARSLVALADEQAAFEGWTRAKGKGPENREPFAFHRRCGDAGCSPDHEDAPSPIPDVCTCGCRLTGGWPGNLAREWARQGGDRRAPMGRSLARLGQHILDAIEGQPSECQRCHGKPHTVISDITRQALGRFATRAEAERAYRKGLAGEPLYSLSFLGECPDCQGTGHNLAGYLPKPEASPRLRRKRADQGMDADGVRSTSDTWLDTELGQWSPGWGLFRVAPNEGAQVHTPDDLEQGTNGLTHRTRVTPRGEHRHTGAWPSAAEAHRRAPKGGELRRDALDRLISERLWDCYSSPDFGLHWPRWRRGELKHAQQRRGPVIRAGAIRVVTQPGPIRVTCEFSIE